MLIPIGNGPINIVNAKSAFLSFSILGIDVLIREEIRIKIIPKTISNKPIFNRSIFNFLFFEDQLKCLLEQTYYQPIKNLHRVGEPLLMMC